MGFKIPNYTEAVATGVGDQAEPDSVDFSILGNPANGVVFDPTNYASNGAVTQTTTESDTVNIAPYKVIIDGTHYHNDSGSITLSLDAGEANPRFDLIVIPKSAPGTPTFRKGTASSTNPQFPAIVDGDIVLAAAYRAGSGATGYVSTADLVDKRLFIPSNTTWINASEPTLVANSDGAKAADGDIWVTTASAATGKSNVWVKSAGTWENLAEYVAMATTSTANNLVLRDASGNFAANVITANTFAGGTFTGTTFSGKASTAGVADSANAVTWSNVSSKPSLVYNDGGNYGINITGNSNYANTAGSAGSATNATNATNAANASQLVEGPYSIDWNGAGWYAYGDFEVGSKFYYFYPTGGSGSTEYLVATSTGEVKTRTGTSLRDHKDNISDITDALETVNKLRPRTFTFKSEYVDTTDPQSVYDLQTQKQYGLVVEEVLEINPELVHHKVDNGTTIPYMWKDNAVISLLVGAVKELTARIEALEAQ